MNITNDKLMEILERNLGLPMGDSGIFYIEDPGQKRINKIYFSKTNMLLYKCTADNIDVTVTGNFKLYSLTNTDEYLGALTGIGRGQVKYIQDVGTKYVNNVYIDKPTGKLYRCITETSSVNNDVNFTENNLNETNDKLQNLSFIEGAILAVIDKIPTTDTLIIDSKFNLNTIRGKICKIYARSTDVSMQSYIFPGNDRTFIVHGKDCKPLTIYFENTGFKLFGNTTGVSWINITEVLIS